jgi:two-component system, chemotaxis family, protein-glutamate methylesterase/glutaminase
VIKRDIVVIGGSAGAFVAVSEILGHLPADLPAAVFVALHLSPTSEEWLSSFLKRSSLLPVGSPAAAESIEPGRIYVARPDRHLIVKEGRVLVNRGPHENLWRPAIDVLFRSAAVAYGNRVIALLTSGELDDGTSGLQAVKACGGTTVVQDPQGALHPAMLQTALTNVGVDHSTPLRDIPALLQRLVHEPADPAIPIPQDLRKEARMVEAPEEAPDLMQQRGAPSGLSCPECGGPLWRGGTDSAQFRCLIGHGFHIKSLADDTDEQIDRTLWAAIRMFEQRVNLSRMLAEQERSQGRQKRADLYDSRADESLAHAQRLRELHLRGAAVLDEHAEPKMARK